MGVKACIPNLQVMHIKKCNSYSSIFSLKQPALLLLFVAAAVAGVCSRAFDILSFRLYPNLNV